MFTLPLDDMHGWFGLGVAGNFAGHSKQRRCRARAYAAAG